MWSSNGLSSERFRVLAIDDELAFLRGLARSLQPRGFELVPFDDPEPALALLEREPDTIDLVLIDRNISPTIDGFDVLARARQIAPDVPTIMLTGDLRDSTAAMALRAGAFHFLTKPIVDFDAVALTLLRAGHFSRLQRRARSLEHKVAITEQFEKMVGSSAKMRELYALVAKVAETDLGVLIQGESGTGKELTARAIHDRSARARGPFVALNCGAIPESLIDSELFGHTKGAFTGASEARPGVFLEAHGGTLFLDEIGELPAAVQARLLRVLQEREVRAIGGSGTRPIDVRVVAATHVDLRKQVEQQRFRADLFYRLNVVVVNLPPLRDRAEDIPLLINHLLAKHAGKMRRPVPHIDPQVVDALTRYDWPGNVRELENLIMSAMALTRGDVLELDALPAHLVPGIPVKPLPAAPPRSAPATPAGEVVEYKAARRQAIDSFELDYFADLMARTGGNLSEASRLSGVDRSNLRRTLAKLGLRGSPGDDS
jgi:DNA-binding NtrC family response regulator